VLGPRDVAACELPIAIDAFAPVVPLVSHDVAYLLDQSGQAREQIAASMTQGSFAQSRAPESGRALSTDHLDTWSNRAHEMRSLPARRAQKFGCHGGCSVFNFGGARQVLHAAESTVRELLRNRLAARALHPMQTFRCHQLIDSLEIIYAIRGLEAERSSIEVLRVDMDIGDAADRYKGSGSVASDKVRAAGLWKPFHVNRSAHGDSPSQSEVLCATNAERGNVKTIFTEQRIGNRRKTKRARRWSEPDPKIRCP
jgi:hypothetical protein